MSPWWTCIPRPRLTAAALVAIASLSMSPGANAEPRALADSVLWIATPPLGVPYQPITLELCNAKTDTIYLSSSAPWSIVDSTDVEVYSPGLALTWCMPIPPGTCFPWAWGQQDNTGRQVPPGRYTAKISWGTTPCDGGHPETAPIFVTGGVYWEAVPDPVPEQTQLDLFLENATADSVTLYDTAPWTITTTADSTIYSATGLPAVDTVLSGTGRTWFWGMLDDGGQPVPAGHYIAKIPYEYASSGETYTAEQPFVIVGPADEVVWKVSPRVNGTRSAVLLSLTNIGPQNVCLPSLAPWRIKDDQGDDVFTPFAAAVIDTVEPGTSRVWAWDERNMSGDPVEGGTYQAEIDYRNPCGDPTTTDVAWFELIDTMTTVDPCEFLVADRFPPLYGSGEPIDFTFTNCVPDTILWPCTAAWWVSNVIGIPVATAYCAWAITPIDAYPIGVMPESWDQLDFDGAQVPDGLYYLWSVFSDKAGATHYFVRSDLPVAIGVDPTAASETVSVERPEVRAAPNPFTAGTRLHFTVPAGGAEVRLRVYDAAGRSVAERNLGRMEAGVQGVDWGAIGPAGERLATGIYFARLEVGRIAWTGKLTVVR